MIIGAANVWCSYRYRCRCRWRSWRWCFHECCGQRVVERQRTPQASRRPRRGVTGIWQLADIHEKQMMQPIREKDRRVCLVSSDYAQTSAKIKQNYADARRRLAEQGYGIVSVGSPLELPERRVRSLQRLLILVEHLLRV